MKRVCARAVARPRRRRRRWARRRRARCGPRTTKNWRRAGAAVRQVTTIASPRAAREASSGVCTGGAGRRATRTRSDRTVVRWPPGAVAWTTTLTIRGVPGLDAVDGAGSEPDATGAQARDRAKPSEPSGPSTVARRSQARRSGRSRAARCDGEQALEAPRAQRQRRRRGRGGSRRALDGDVQPPVRRPHRRCPSTRRPPGRPPGTAARCRRCRAAARPIVRAASKAPPRRPDRGARDAGGERPAPGRSGPGEQHAAVRGQRGAQSELRRRRSAARTSGSKRSAKPTSEVDEPRSLVRTGAATVRALKAPAVSRVTASTPLVDSNGPVPPRDDRAAAVAHRDGRRRVGDREIVVRGRPAA